MLEVKVNVVIVAPELMGAINNLAAAISNGKVLQPQFNATMPVAHAPVNVPTPVPAPTPAPMPVATPAQPVVPATPAVPVQQPTTPIAGVPLASAPQFSVDQIMAAGATLMDAGRVEDLMNLLHSFGVQAVMDLKPEQLGAFATEMRKLGAAI